MREPAIRTKNRTLASQGCGTLECFTRDEGSATCQPGLTVDGAMKAVARECDGWFAADENPVGILKGEGLMK